MPGKRRYYETEGSSKDVEAGPSAPSTSNKATKDSDTSTTTLMVSGFSPNYTSDSLSTLLSSIGPIRSAFIVTTQGQDKRGKGYGFAKFVLKDDAEKAISDLDGTLVDGRKIKVQWAKRRQRGEREKPGRVWGAPGPDTVVADDAAADDKSGFISIDQPEFPKQETPASDNVKNAYAARREAKRAAKQSGEAGSIGASLDPAKDSRTIIVEGGLDMKIAEEKKALQKKLKKLVEGINTGMASLKPTDVHISEGTVSIISSNNEEGTPKTTVEPVTYLECPTAKTAHQLADRIHNSVIKGHLLRARNKFDSDTITRKGRSVGGGRVIVRNLGFEVTVADLAAAFCVYGQIHSITLQHGFSFIWYMKREDAEKAIQGMNGKRIYAGMVRDRIEESANHKLSSVVRKEQKGKIVGVRGRPVAVDWALGKKEFETIEKQEQAQPEKSGSGNNAQKTTVATNGDKDTDEDEEDGSDLDPLPMDDDAEEEDESSGSDDDASESEGVSDMSPEPMEEDQADIDPTELAVPSDVEADEEEAEEKKQEDQGTTLFVRNLQFEATEDELFTLFKGFGPVRYARIVIDPVTKRSRGTGFVNFYREEDAAKCMKEADDLALVTGVSTNSSEQANGKGKQTAKAPVKSLLTVDPSSALAAKFTLHGRVVAVSEAVSKDKANRLREDRDRSGKTKDRRNLYLMHEGTILPESPLAASLATADVQARTQSFESRRNLLRSNPSLYISRTRLAIRQIPLFVTDGMLRRLAGWAIKAFNQEVKAGRRSKLTYEETKEPTDALGTQARTTASDDKSKKYTKVKQAKILRQDDRVDPVTGLKRSKGYGFLELLSHADALRVIRWANANKEVHALFHAWLIEDLQNQIKRLEADKGDETRIKRMKDRLEQVQAEDDAKIARQGKTLIIEFSIENAVTVKRRQEKVEKLKERTVKRKREADEEEAEAKESAEAEKSAAAYNDASTRERNKLGFIIGKKRRIAKAKKGGK